MSRRPHAHNGEIALAYQILGEGPVDLVFVSEWVGNLELRWDNPLYARFLNRLVSFSRLILVESCGPVRRIGQRCPLRALCGHLPEPHDSPDRLFELPVEWPMSRLVRDTDAFDRRTG
jgi:hypothetical protein